MSGRRETTILRLLMFLTAVVFLSPPSNAQDPSNYVLQTGTPTFAANDVFPFGTVDIANGNLHLEIPLGSYPQRGGKSLSLKLVYDSRVWGVINTGTEETYSYASETNGQNLPLGWRIVGDPKVNNLTILNGDTCCVAVWTDPDGTQHEFALSPTDS